MAAIKQLHVSQLHEIYHTRMQADFPPAELKPFSTIEHLTKQGVYISFGFFGGAEEILSYALLAKTFKGKAAMLDYYAVSSAQRGTGIGGAFITQLPHKLTPMGIDYMLLEVECVEAAENEEEAQIRKRRIHFYKKNGCLMSGVRSKVFGVDYNVMYLPFLNETIGNGTIMNELDRIYHLVLQKLTKTDSDYKRHVQIWLQ